MGEALQEFFAAVYPVLPQFLLVVALTLGIGATNKLSFDAQGVMGSDIFADETTTESKNQYKFIAFGFAKAFANVFTAVYSDKLGKTKILSIGWIAGIVHASMVLGQVFEVTIWSNIFLGIQQGVCWSLMIFYMIDYAGPSNRALAVGLNETVS
jgi:MFS family permease